MNANMKATGFQPCKGHNSDCKMSQPIDLVRIPHHPCGEEWLAHLFYTKEGILLTVYRPTEKSAQLSGMMRRGPLDRGRYAGMAATRFFALWSDFPAGGETDIDDAAYAVIVDLMSAQGFV